MSCFFCSATTHISQFCDVLVDDESRKAFIELKNYCDSCLNIKHKLNENDECQNNRKCFICFSETHLTIFCPDRFTAPKLFLPNIDKILVKRFTEILSLEEKFSLIATVPNFADLIKFKKLTVVKEFKNQSKNIVIRNIVELTFADSPLFDSVFLRDIILKPASIFLCRSTISSKDFFLLISAKTVVLKCEQVRFESKISFTDIISKIPNIEILKMLALNIVFENGWVQGLLKYKKGNNFKELKLRIKNINFSLNDLVTFIKTKSVKHICIDLAFVLSSSESFDEKNYYKKYQCSNCLTEIQKLCMEQPFLQVSYVQEQVFTNLSSIYYIRSTKMFTLINNNNVE